MGMDVCGKGNPEAYFRNNIWSWRPLADYIQDVAPDIAANCEYWHSNEGDGLDEAQSLALADVLQNLIDSGSTARYAATRASDLERLPNKPCDICEGTGRRKPIGERGAGDVLTGIKCNGCKATGYVRPWECSYPFSVENVVKFVAFLRICKGFEIC